MKLFVQETRSSLIKKYLFANNDVTMQWLPLSGKFVHKANGGCTQAVVIHPVNCACVAGVPSTRSVHRGQV